MSLRVFHIIFVMVCVAFCVWVAVWGARTHEWVLAAVFVAAGVVLVVYGQKVYVKLRDLP